MRITINYKQQKQQKPTKLEYVIFLAVMLLVFIQLINSSRNTFRTNAEDIDTLEQEIEDTEIVESGVIKMDVKPEALPVKEVEVVEDDLTLKIQKKYKEVNSPIADKVPFIVEESKKRGLNPALVLAVQAKESGWGRSEYCQVNHNCFGYGATDSGNIDYWFNNETYEEGTLKILNSFEAYYKVNTPEDMASRGYNFYSEWVVGVNEIMNYWN